MPRHCERPGCSAPASVAYGFEPERFIVWIETAPDDTDALRSGVLCRRHADALTPPRGWWLDDRRVAMPQLFRVAADTPAKPSRRRDAGRKRGEDLTGELPFDAIAAEAAAAEAAGRDSAAGKARSADLVAPPGLAEADAHDDRPSPAAQAAAVIDPDETKALPWSPRFDQNDDLDGLLRPNSPLLSRAFRGMGGSRRPTDRRPEG